MIRYKLRKKHLLLCFIFFCFIPLAWAETFVVKAIDIRGLQGISKNTVLNYLPIEAGDALSDADSGSVLRALYDTGFFDDVQLEREKNHLVVYVKERPTIGSIKISGNKDITKEALLKVFKSVGLVEGHIFNEVLLERMQHELTIQYNSRGKYNARIEAQAHRLPRNRVAVDITISEGRAARIKMIRLIGNDSFPSDKLVKLYQSPAQGFMDYFAGGKEYTKVQMDQFLMALQSFYFNKGYINYKVESSQVSLTPDRKQVYITVKISEGAIYHFKGFDFSGTLMLPREQLEALVPIKKGQLFSRKAVKIATMTIGQALGNEGYAFARIVPKPVVDTLDQTVFIIFDIDPGRKIYVRRINFTGNIKTGDYVLRRVLRQDEAVLLKTKQLRESERQLRILGYLKDVKISTKPVSNTNNQVDIEVEVDERPSVEAVLSASYGTDGFGLNANFKEYNFAGTGNTVGLGFSANKAGQSYNLSHYNPYYTPSGIGRGFGVYYRHSTPGKVEISNYTTDSYGTNLYYTIPLSDNSNAQAGIGYQYLHVTSLGSSTSDQVRAYVEKNGDIFRQFRGSVGWTYNSFDRLPFPTRGWYHSLSGLLALPGGSGALSYYKTTYMGRWYKPMMKGLIFTMSARLGYGNSFSKNQGYPFFENFFAGGLGVQGQVRGFDHYSLGPKSTLTQTTGNCEDSESPACKETVRIGKPLGGNMLVSGSAGLVLPYPFSRPTFRSEVFVDIGNVFYDGLAEFGGVEGGPLRASVGLQVNWQSPFGPLAFALSTPLKKEAGDDRKFFDLSVSSAF